MLMLRYIIVTDAVDSTEVVSTECIVIGASMSEPSLFPSLSKEESKA